LLVTQRLVGCSLHSVWSVARYTAFGRLLVTQRFAGCSLHSVWPVARYTASGWLLVTQRLAGCLSAPAQNSMCWSSAVHCLSSVNVVLANPAGQVLHVPNGGPLVY